MSDAFPQQLPAAPKGIRTLYTGRTAAGVFVREYVKYGKLDGTVEQQKQQYLAVGATLVSEGVAAGPPESRPGDPLQNIRRKARTVLEWVVPQTGNHRTIEIVDMDSANVR